MEKLTFSVLQCYICVSVSAYQLKNAEIRQPSQFLVGCLSQKACVSASGSDSGAPSYIMWDDVGYNSTPTACFSSC